MADTDIFSDLEILALTAIGESDSLDEDGMQQTINTVMNRASANIHWMGGASARTVCLQKRQYNCWDAGTGDRQRIIDIGTRNPTYSPYLKAASLAERALAGNLPDITNGAVSYFDWPASGHGQYPWWAKGKEPCAIVGHRHFYDLKAVS